jgi:hypothetical protein
MLSELSQICDTIKPLQNMPLINFAEPLAEDDAAAMPHPIETVRDFKLSTETVAFVEPSRFRTTRLGRSEWTNILFAGIVMAGGLFCAFYFFNGAELVGAALTRPGEYLYPRPFSSGEKVLVAANAVTDEAPLPGIPTRSLKTDSRGDPFSRASKLITIDRSVRSFPRGGGGLRAGSRPPAFGSLVSPGVPGGSVGGLPGPGTLISRLTLLLPGGDALTQTLQAVADVTKG